MVRTTLLGGSAKDVSVAKVGTGLMMLSWNPAPDADTQAFEAIKAAIDATPAGSKMLLNSSQFYARDFGTANLELLARFFDAHPGYADRVFLSVKGGTKPNTLDFDPSPEGLRTSIDLCTKALRGTKKIDLFENARVTRDIPIAKQYEVLKGFVDEGLIGHIGLSECSAATIREVNALVPVAAVEVEVSPWSYEEETKKVIATCAELGIAVVAYSPLGRGFLTGEMAKLSEDDMRNRLSRFQGENSKNNLKLVEALKQFAEKKGITAAQLCLAWVQSLGDRVIPIPGSSKASRVIGNINTSEITFTSDELTEIAKILEENPVSGGRYFEGVPDNVLHLWG